MRRTRTVKSRRRTGFTLLEVLLVVAILALLAAAVVPQLIGTEKKAKIQKTIADVGWGGAIASALELYRTHMGSYPEELTGLTEKPDDDEGEKWGGPYITDPGSLKDAWGSDFQYKSPGEYNAERFDLWSYGPDAQDGTEDDITNWKKD